jgi:hypothetical protein
MRGALILLLLVLAGPLRAQGTADPRGTVRLGLGATFGGVGVQGELFPAAASLSLLAAVGYGPIDVANSPDQVTFSVATRAYLGRGPKQRSFAELSYSPIAADQVADPVTGDYESATLYGLGLQLGTQLPLWSSGLHLIIGLGAGYALTPNVVASRWKFINQAGVGFAFGHRHANVQ